MKISDFIKNLSVLHIRKIYSLKLFLKFKSYTKIDSPEIDKVIS